MKKITKVIKDKKGITLVALVVTIIILLILATVTINLVIGSNGIFNRAKDSVNKYEDASIEEMMEMYKAATMLDSNKKTIREMLIEDNKVDEQELNSNGLISLSESILIVSSFEGLKEISNNVSNGDDYSNKKIYVINNIDCGAQFNIETGELLTGENFTPIGYSHSNIAEEENDTAENKIFNGIFEGCNYEISNLYIKKNNEGDFCTALFGYVGEDGIIRDLKIKDSYIRGYYETAAFVGRNKGLIQNCINETTVVGDYYLTGGIAGRSAGIVEDCINRGNIIGGVKQTGGIVANCDFGENAIIRNCTNYGMIDSQGDSVGGIVGGSFAQGHLIENCKNLGNVGNLNNDALISIGGIAGVTNSGTLRNSYNLGEVKGYQQVGGIIGYSQIGSVQDCYNNGNVEGAYVAVGGVSGFINGSQIDRCYNLAKITLSERGYFGVGGIAGRISSTFANSIINECYNSGEVYSLANMERGKQTGGIVGQSSSETGNIEIKNCYNKGFIHGIGRVAGIAGLIKNTTINNCYNVGLLEKEQTTLNNGGIIGYMEGEYNVIDNNYWIDTCGANNGIASPESDEGSAKKNENDMKEIYNSLSESFIEDSKNINNGFPILNWQR